METNAYLDRLKEERQGHTKTIKNCVLFFLLVGLPILSLPEDSDVKYVMLTPIAIVVLWGLGAWWQHHKTSNKIWREETHTMLARVREREAQGISS